MEPDSDFAADDVAHDDEILVVGGQNQAGWPPTTLPRCPISGYGMFVSALDFWLSNTQSWLVYQMLRKISNVLSFCEIY
jgi:hypothetical protein